MTVELHHHPLCAQGLVSGGHCTCEPELWVRLDDVVEALRSEAAHPWVGNVSHVIDYIKREFGATA